MKKENNIRSVFIHWSRIGIKKALREISDVFSIKRMIQKTKFVLQRH